MATSSKGQKKTLSQSSDESASAPSEPGAGEPRDVKPGPDLPRDMLDARRWADLDAMEKLDRIRQALISIHGHLAGGFPKSPTATLYATVNGKLDGTSDEKKTLRQVVLDRTEPGSNGGTTGTPTPTGEPATPRELVTLIDAALRQIQKKIDAGVQVELFTRLLADFADSRARASTVRGETAAFRVLRSSVLRRIRQNGLETLSGSPTA